MVVKQKVSYGVVVIVFVFRGYAEDDLSIYSIK